MRKTKTQEVLEYHARANKRRAQKVAAVFDKLDGVGLEPMAESLLENMRILRRENNFLSSYGVKVRKPKRVTGEAIVLMEQAYRVLCLAGGIHKELKNELAKV